MRAISFFQKKQLPEKRLAIRNYYEKKDQKLFSLVLFLLLLFLLIIYLIFFTPIFKIKTISFEIKDNQMVKINENELRNEINKILSQNFYFFPLDNIFFFPKKKIKMFLSQDQRIENFEIKIIFPQKIKIKISTWLPQAIFVQSSDYFLLNKNGQIIKKIPKNEVGEIDLPIIYNKTEKKDLPFLSIFNFLERLVNSDFSIIEVRIFEDKGVLNYQAITSEGWQIYFTPEEDINSQINNLFLILREKISDRSQLDYIDLRFGNRLFYKYK
ncbi:MAG: cell division protein FtsQ/DivIB [Patescibacteria group bacterium]